MYLFQDFQIITGTLFGKKGQKDLMLPSVLIAMNSDMMLAQKPVLRIRIRMFLGLPDPDQIVRGTDPAPDPAPDPSIIKKK